ncbi:MAG: tetratricopeptide repeat protein, partial [bacterium]
NSKKPDYYWARARWKPRCLLALGELHLTRGNPEAAQGFLDQAIEHGWIEKFPYKQYQVRAQRLQGTLLTAQGNLEQAETALKRALKLARELGSPTQLWLTEHALATLYAGLGEGNSDGNRNRNRNRNRKKAANHYQAALATVQDIARDLTEPRLKEGFLASAPIRQLMAQAEQT